MRRLLVVVVLATSVVSQVAEAAVPQGRRIRPADIQQLRDAAAVTLAAGPREYALEILLSVQEDPPSPDKTYQPFTAEGVIDPATGATVATFGVADERFPDDATANTLEVRSPSSAISYVGTEDSFELPPGKEFVEVPTDQLKNAATTTSSLKYLSSFVGTPKFRGAGDDRGTKTKTFVISIPIRTILEAGGIPTTTATDRELRRLERSGQGNAIGNVEIDRQGRIHGFATYVALDTKGRSELTIAGQYFNYGAALDATPPPPDQVVPFDQAPEKLRELLGLNTPPT